MPKRNPNIAELKNPPLTLGELVNRLDECRDYVNSEDILIRLSKLGGPDLYVTGVYIPPDNSYVRLTASIGEIEVNEVTNKEKSTSK